MVSDGPPAEGITLMPDFVGKAWEEAEGWAKSHNLRTAKEERTAANQKPGNVVEQSLAADTVVSENMAVKWVVAGGDSTPPATVPHGMSFAVPQGSQAKSFVFILESNNEQKELWRGDLEPGMKQEIPLPTDVPHGAKIKIYANGILVEEREAKQ